MRGHSSNSVCYAVMASLTLLGRASADAADKAAKPVRLTETQRIWHTLDRLGFGPRPGDVERVRKMGLSRYVEMQLHPDAIPDAGLDSKLQPFTTLTLPSEQLTESYRNVARRTEGTVQADMPAAREARRREAQREYRIFTARVVGELQAAKILRATESERKLQEVMVDFWSNHFNIDVRKGAARALKTVDDRDVTRAHALGKFRDLLGASAKSPAMLIYLDNARSSGPLPAGLAGRAGQRMRGGLNENYARELMELHTLGVDGGYTQQDVTEVARCFTGWTVNPGTGQFLFTPRRHDNGQKVVLGQKIPSGGGMEDGERVLDILASHPSTARHIARKLCLRFVSDEPPSSVVKKAEDAFRRTKGDIRSVVRAIVTSPEFFSPAAFRAKVKSPFEYVVSAVRAVDGHFDPGRTGTALRSGQSLTGQLATMGEPLFQFQAPTGYPEDSRHWVGAGPLIARMNFAVSLVNGQVRGVLLPDYDPNLWDEDKPEESLGRFELAILDGGATAPTHAALSRYVKQRENDPDRAMLYALLLGSPEFQRR